MGAVMARVYGNIISEGNKCVLNADVLYIEIFKILITTCGLKQLSIIIISFMAHIEITR